MDSERNSLSHLHISVHAVDPNEDDESQANARVGSNSTQFQQKQNKNGRNNTML